MRAELAARLADGARHRDTCTHHPASASSCAERPALDWLRPSSAWLAGEFRPQLWAGAGPTRGTGGAGSVSYGPTVDLGVEGSACPA